MNHRKKTIYSQEKFLARITTVLLGPSGHSRTENLGTIDFHVSYGVCLEKTKKNYFVTFFSFNQKLFPIPMGKLLPEDEKPERNHTTSKKLPVQSTK